MRVVECLEMWGQSTFRASQWSVVIYCHKRSEVATEGCIQGYYRFQNYVDNAHYGDVDASEGARQWLHFFLAPRTHYDSIAAGGVLCQVLCSCFGRGRGRESTVSLPHHSISASLYYCYYVGVQCDNSFYRFPLYFLVCFRWSLYGVNVHFLLYIQLFRLLRCWSTQQRVYTNSEFWCRHVQISGNIFAKNVSLHWWVPSLSSIFLILYSQNSVCTVFFYILASNHWCGVVLR